MTSLKYVGGAATDAVHVVQKFQTDATLAGRCTPSQMRDIVATKVSTKATKQYIDEQDNLRATTSYVDSQDSLYLPTSQRGAANGVCELGSTGAIPPARAPKSWLRPTIFAKTWTSSSFIALSNHTAATSGAEAILLTQSLNVGTSPKRVLVFGNFEIWGTNIVPYVSVRVGGQEYGKGFGRGTVTVAQPVTISPNWGGLNASPPGTGLTGNVTVQATIGTMAWGSNSRYNSSQADWLTLTVILLPMS